MSDNKQPFTAEEIREQACARSAQDKRLFYTDVKSYMLGFYSGYDYQAAALREEQETTAKMMVKYKGELDQSNARLLTQCIELEAVKKERHKWQQECMDWKKDCELVIAQRDEAVKLLKEVFAVLLEKGCKVEYAKNIDKEIERLSSGKTKPVSPLMSLDTCPYDEPVLFYTHDGNIIQDFWYDEELGDLKKRYAYWMPLPAPPESSNQNEQK